MTYKVVIFNAKHTFPLKGLNELLDAQKKQYDERLKKYKVTNEVKANNDRICRIGIRKAMKGIKINNPIRCHFKIFAKDKMHDRGNIYTAVEKSFLDALQDVKVIKNDTFDLVLDSTFCTELDRKNPRVEVIIEEVIK